MLGATLIGLAGWGFLALLVGILAGSWNRNGLLWALGALLISPLLAVVLLLAMGKVDVSSSGPSKLRCPKCNTVNPPGASYCSGCGAEIVGAK